MQLSIVIHTEEEFDWNGGFFKANDNVTHGEKLTQFCKALITEGAKITFALDYAFVNSQEGQKVIDFFKTQYNNVEFATHLHPWVNPPFAEGDQVTNFNSYPGNLGEQLEFEKLKSLTNIITEVCGVKPTTYLAGRYGISEHTVTNLKKLGYKTDVSISPFCDFTHQEGPNFSSYNNDIFVNNEILYWPHTTSVLAITPSLERWFNQKPSRFETYQKNFISRLLMKVLRVKRQRLSPEGFALADLKKITRAQMRLGQKDFILSFHSPSIKAGLTPYVKEQKDEDHFLTVTIDYIKWFHSHNSGQFVLVKEKEYGVRQP
ncbi:hypothetical protein [Paraglaciecola sp.]|uniref:hypothetical protein n=1 Tax=Paraglaciecola sp. TaxID=1920173 RepID=UPI00273EF84D|nr:hypothetical protein [Paraglaciecola sp.]MDP5030332.1 hypothetical protein [Paraglaciecola sp.]